MLVETYAGAEFTLRFPMLATAGRYSWTLRGPLGDAVSLAPTTTLTEVYAALSRMKADYVDTIFPLIGGDPTTDEGRQAIADRWTKGSTQPMADWEATLLTGAVEIAAETCKMSDEVRHVVAAAIIRAMGRA